MKPTAMRQFWVKAPDAREAFGPVNLERIKELMAAGIVRDSSWISDGDSDFMPVSALPAEAWKAASDNTVSAPTIRDSDGPDPGVRATDGFLSEGYEAADVLRFNRSLEKEPDLNLPSIWREPRMRDKLRFVGAMMPLTGVFAYGVLRLKESGGMEYAPLATLVWLATGAMVYGFIFVLHPTRAGM